MTLVNRRRPEGYHGNPQEVLRALQLDAEASLRYSVELTSRRVIDWTEINHESRDAALRAIPRVRLARLGFFTARIAAIEEEGIRVRTEACKRQLERPITSRSIEEAAEFIAQHAGKPKVTAAAILADSKAMKGAYRRASKRLHPDIGGDARMMQRLTEAHSVLEAHRN